MRWMVEGANPTARAIERRLQCVASRGVVSSVRRIVSATSSSPIRRGAPGRGSSRRPSIRRSANRRRHLPTVLGAASTRRLMSLFSAPSAAKRTMRARWASGGVSALAMLGLGVSDDQFDRRAAAEFAFGSLGDATSLARDIDLELVTGRGVVAAIAAVGDDAGEVGADLGLDLRDHGGERVTVVGVAGQRLGMGDELTTLGAIERGGERHLDPELTWAFLRQACFNVA